MAIIVPSSSTIAPAVAPGVTRSANLDMAHSQWANRPKDERFASVPALRDALAKREASIVVRDVKPEALSCGYDDKRHIPTLLHRETGVPLALTNWSAGQVCRMAEVPHGFLSTLSPETAGRVMAERWEATASKRSGDTMRLQVTKDSGRGFGVRAITSTKYDRVPDVRICDHLQTLVDDGWKLAPARPNNGTEGYPLTADDVGAHTFMQAGEIGIPSGLYAGDRDIFAFLVDVAHPITEPGKDEPLFRGICVSGSDVGARAYTLDGFVFRKVCGNHIIWDARELVSMRAVHLGSAASSLNSRVRYTMSAWRNSGTDGLTQWISKAQTLILGDSRQSIVDMLFAKRITGRKEAEALTISAERMRDVDGDPRSAWGIMQAITRASQEDAGSSFAGSRWDADAAGAKVASLVSVN